MSLSLRFSVGKVAVSSSFNLFILAPYIPSNQRLIEIQHIFLQGLNLIASSGRLLGQRPPFSSSFVHFHSNCLFLQFFWTSVVKSASFAASISIYLVVESPCHRCQKKKRIPPRRDIRNEVLMFLKCLLRKLSSKESQEVLGWQSYSLVMTNIAMVEMAHL